jgi:hypothetical protein
VTGAGTSSLPGRPDSGDGGGGNGNGLPGAGGSGIVIISF